MNVFTAYEDLPGFNDWGKKPKLSEGRIPPKTLKKDRDKVPSIDLKVLEKNPKKA